MKALSLLDVIRFFRSELHSSAIAFVMYRGDLCVTFPLPFSGIPSNFFELLINTDYYISDGVIRLFIGSVSPDAITKVFFSKD